MSQHCANNRWANNRWADDRPVNDRPANDQRDGGRPGDDRTPSPASSDADRSSGRLDVSMPQVAGGALASVTAAYLGSYLGAAGTFWGAGLTSVVITVVGALYQRSLEKTKDRANAAAVRAALKRAAGKPFDGGVAPRAADPTQDATRLIRPRSSSPLSGMRWPGGEQVVDEPVDGRRSAAPEPGRTRADQARFERPRSGSEQESRTRMLRWDGTRYVPPAASGTRADAMGPESSSPASNSPGSSGSGPRRVRWAALAATGALMFGLCMLVVTGFEGITGKPMSGGGTGTTLGGVFRPGPQGPEPGAEVPAAPETSSRPSQQPEPSQRPERSRQPGSVERSTSPEPGGPRAPTTSARPTGEPAPSPSTTGSRPTGTAPAGGVGTRQPTPEAEPEVADQNSSGGNEFAMSGVG